LFFIFHRIHLRRGVALLSWVKREMVLDIDFKDKVETHVKNQGIGFWIFLGILLLVTIFVLLLDVRLLTTNYVKDYGYVAVFTFSLISDFLIQPIGPDVILIIAMSLKTLSPWYILFYVLLGSYVTMAFGYFIGLRLGDPALRRILGRRAYAKMHKNMKYGKLYLVLSTLTPLPYIPFLPGMWKLSFSECLLYVVLPRTLRFVAVFLVMLWFV
jgi:membrane protein YqaA with SNARE-associated domain